MDKVNLKRYQYIKNARVHRTKWTLILLLLLILLLNILIIVVKNSSFGVILISILLFIFLCILIITYYCYIQFFAKCYICKCCHQKFVEKVFVGFLKNLNVVSTKSRSNVYARVENYDAHGFFGWRYGIVVVKCPYCNKRMIGLDVEDNFDEECL